MKNITIITGGSKGVGYELAKQFLTHGGGRERLPDCKK